LVILQAFSAREKVPEGRMRGCPQGKKGILKRMRACP